MLENKKVKDSDIHYSRYCSAWNQATGLKPGYSDYFAAWLRSEGCDEDEIRAIQEMGGGGKFELERSAEAFIKNMPPDRWYGMN